MTQSKSGSVWDAFPEAATYLVEAWGRGESAAAIARGLNRGLAQHGVVVTRNAVIGKVRRLRLEYRKQRPKSRAKRPPGKMAPSMITMADKRRSYDRPAAPAITPRGAKTKAERALERAERIELAQASAAAVMTAMEAEERAIPSTQRVPILIRNDRGNLEANTDLHARCCRWPIGDPLDVDDFGFCGHLTVGTTSYCAAHLERLPPRRQDVSPPPEDFAGRTGSLLEQAFDGGE